jgi:5-methylcytosine-specific restriction protein B
LPTDEEIVEAIQEFCKVARFLNAESVAPLSTSAVVAQVAEAIHWSEQRVAELLESLSDSSPQIVLAGPPGTGKTYVSRWVASALLGAPGVLDDPRITLVQFHPTYGYEDFVEGLRPVSKDGAVVFETTPGPIVRLAKEIKDNDEPRVLIIDEINRANIPRVFGELMYLLEYRDQSMDLMLEPNFVLPSQLHIIATMNTADKSTRVMDVALRRRFDFFQLDPDVDVLKAHYADGHQNELGDELFDGFISLNNRLMEDLDRHRLIGHSYFMTDHMDAHVLRARWNRQICPLLEEYFYERQVKDERYQMGEFWPSAAGA